MTKSQPAIKPKPVYGDTPLALVKIIDEHRYVIRLFSVLAQEAKGLLQGKACDYDVVADILNYMSNYPDRFHHPKEDLIFDGMIKASKGKLAGPTAKVIARLREGHKQIDANAAMLSANLPIIKTTRSKKKRKQFGESLNEYMIGLRSHMALEEKEIFKPAIHLLSNADWRAIDKAIAPISDPVFGDQQLKQYGDLFDRYVDTYDGVQLGGVSPHLSETVLGAAERNLYALKELRALPRRLIKHSSLVSKQQFERFQTLCLTRDINASIKLIKSIANESRVGVATSIDMVKAALAAKESVLEKGGDHSAVASLIEEEDFITFSGQSLVSDEPAKISWQAILVSVALRLTLKQAMAHMNMDLASKVKNFTGERTIPAGFRAERVEDAGFSGQWIRSKNQASTRRTLLYLPGGGFVFPAVSSHATILATLVEQTQSQGLMVDYRLAPEHPFPAGLDDALAAYKHLLDSGITADQIMLGGDSAGGGLSMSLLLALREEGLPLPCGVTLICPLVDLSFSGASRDYNRWRDAMLPTSREMMAHKFYSGEHSTDLPLISPIYGDLSGLPPIFIQVGSTEILLDDSLRMARKARSQGVDVHVEVWDSMPHDWHLFSFLPEAKDALSRIADFYNHQLAKQALLTPAQPLRVVR
jgi:acetyl esterase/lipase/hemerythrin-like domain-containing protein